MGSLLSAGGKSRSATTFTGSPLKSLDRNLVNISGSQGLNNELVSQLSEALRTGGIGAQIPIIGQAVGNAKEATSQAMQGTTDELSRSGLARSPYGQRILAQTGMQGAQDVAKLPTDIAQNFINQAPQFSSQLLGQILGTLQKQTSRSGPYGV